MSACRVGYFSDIPRNGYCDAIVTLGMSGATFRIERTIAYETL